MPSTTHQSCLICQNKTLTQLRGYEDAFLTSCDKCGFVFSEKIPTESELIAYYNGYGRNDFLSDITIKRYNELLNSLEKYRKTNRILDVGCGIGYFLEVAQKRGWEVYGTEYTDEAIKICKGKGISMAQGQLNPETYEEGFFDVVTSFEVIEHINNPLEEIKNIEYLVRPGGAFYFTTPNFNSLLRYKLKIDYNVICYPEHLSYYTPKTIHRLLKINNFKKIYIKTTGISLTRLRTSTKKSDQAFISKNSDDEKIRQSIENKPYLQMAKSAINTGLTLLGVGDSLKGLYQKR